MSPKRKKEPFGVYIRRAWRKWHSLLPSPVKKNNFSKSIKNVSFSCDTKHRNVYFFIATPKHHPLWNVETLYLASVEVGVLDPTAVWAWGASGVLFKIWVAYGCLRFDARAPVFLCARFVQFSWYSRPWPVHAATFCCAPHSGTLVLVPLYVARWVSANWSISTLHIQQWPIVKSIRIFK